MQSRRRLTQVAAAAAAVGTFGAFAAQAAATPTLAVNAACYVLTKTVPAMSFSGTGYTPGDDIVVSSSDGSVDVDATADATGTITGQTPAPTPNFSAPGSKTVTLTATDEPAAGGQLVGSTPVTVAPFGVEHGATKKAPGLKALSEKTNWSFSGFPSGKTVYGHFTLKGKQVARAKYGVATGPCGLLKTRARLYPATPHHKSYPVQWDSVKKFSKVTQPRIVGTVKLITLGF